MRSGTTRFSRPLRAARANGAWHVGFDDEGLAVEHDDAARCSVGGLHLLHVRAEVLRATGARRDKKATKQKAKQGFHG